MKSNLEKDKYFYDVVMSGEMIFDEISKEFLVAGTGKVLGARQNKSGYTYVTWKRNKEFITIGKHRLLWLIKNGLIEDPEMNVMFKDNNNTNCSIDNLYLGIANRKKKRNSVRGGDKVNAYFTDEQVIALREEYRQKPFVLRHRAKELNMNHFVLSGALRGKTYKHLPDPVEIVLVYKKPSKPKEPKPIKEKKEKPVKEKAIRTTKLRPKENNRILNNDVEEPFTEKEERKPALFQPKPKPVFREVVRSVVKEAPKEKPIHVYDAQNFLCYHLDKRGWKFDAIGKELSIHPFLVSRKVKAYDFFQYNNDKIIYMQENSENTDIIERYNLK